MDDTLALGASPADKTLNRSSAVLLQRQRRASKNFSESARSFAHGDERDFSGTE
jgi:hypothetical protein